MNKKVLLIYISLFLFVLIFSFVACDDTSCEGEVIKKEFLEEHSEVRLMPVTIFNGKTTTIMMIPYSFHYPNRWRITVKWYSDGEFHTREIYVTEECYNKVTIGDWFVYDKDFCTYTEPCEKNRER